MLIGSGNRWSGHGEGAARLLKARGEYAAQKQDAFETTILASLTASVVGPNVILVIAKYVLVEVVTDLIF